MLLSPFRQPFHIVFGAEKGIDRFRTEQIYPPFFLLTLPDKKDAGARYARLRARAPQHRLARPLGSQGRQERPPV